MGHCVRLAWMGHGIRLSCLSGTGYKIGYFGLDRKYDWLLWDSEHVIETSEFGNLSK